MIFSNFFMSLENFITLYQYYWFGKKNGIGENEVSLSFFTIFKKINEVKKIHS